MSGAEILLDVEGVEAIYNHSIVALHGVSLTVRGGEVLTLLGSNGAGKTTTLRAVSNLLPAARGKITAGRIRFAGHDVLRTSPSDLVRLGLVQVLEGRHCFRSLSIEENLVTGGLGRGSGRTEIAQDLERVYSLFPRLKARRKTAAGLASGGEQQMTAIGRALLSRPRLLVLDEPSMGLAPLIVQDIFGALRTLNREDGLSILMAEQNSAIALRYADRATVLENGLAVLEGAAAELRERADIKALYLGRKEMVLAKATAPRQRPQREFIDLTSREHDMAQVNLLRATAEDHYSKLDAVIADVVQANAELNDLEARFPRDNLDALAAIGWNGVLNETRFGGLGLGHVDFAEAAYRIGQADASTGLIYVMHVGAAQTINLFGSDDQKERWLKPNNRHLLGTYSTSERASGGHWWYNFSEASRDGDDYIVNAEKSFTTSSGKADFYLVQTRSPGAKDQTDIIFFIVDGSASGIESSPWEALGVRANHSGPIRYRGVKVPRRDRLGAEGQGKEIIYDGVSPVYLIGLGAVWEGVARGALEAAIAHTRGFVHKDKNKSLTDYQAIRQQLGEAKVLVETLRPWRNELAAKLDDLWKAGKPQSEILIPLTEFKVHAAEVANKVAGIALTVTGGYGYRRGPIERSYRDARAAIAMGPSNIIARDWIGKSLVGLPLELFYEGGE